MSVVSADAPRYGMDRPDKPIRQVLPDGVVVFYCPSCDPRYRRKLLVGKFTGWVEGYCRQCHRWHVFHERGPLTGSSSGPKRP